MRFFSNTINQVNELEKIEKELDRYEPNSEGWLIQCLELQKAQVAVVGGGIVMFLGIYSIYDSMLKEGIYKWSDREFLIDQFEQLLILQSITKDKKIKEISMGMCIAVAGLIEGEFYFCTHPSVGRANKMCQNAWSRWTRDTMKKGKKGQLKQRNIDSVTERFVMLVKNVSAK